jgi:tellurite resistance protein
MVTEPQPGRSIANLPVSLFASVMGIGGLSLAWARAAQVFSVSSNVGKALGWAAGVVLVVVAVAYAAKVVHAFGAVVAEWTHPVKMAFVPTIPIAFLVFATALLPEHPHLAEYLWWPGAVGQLIMTVVIVRGWIASPKMRLEHIHPGWFIPVVGNILVPVAGVSFASRQAMWFFFAVGLVYWIALLPLILGRLIAAEPLPPRLLPTLAVLISPPAVGAIAWVKLDGHWGDPVSTILVSAALFHGILLLAMIPELRKAPMGPSNWAYTFPLAALTAALLADAAATGCGMCKWIGVAFLGLTSAVVLWVTMCTIRSVVTGALLSPEPAPEPAPAIKA